MFRLNQVLHHRKNGTEENTFDFLLRRIGFLFFFCRYFMFFVRQTNLSRLPDSFRADVTYVLYRIVSYQENLRTTEFEIDCQS